ncbi:MAG: hypothetical protein WCL23_00710 [Candidatus Moraniibacteriota bacterium]
MKISKRSVAFLVAALLLVPSVTGALGFGTIDSAGTTYQTVSTTAGMTESSAGQILVNVMNWLMMLLGIGAIISFVIAGVMYLIAAGDETKTESAKKMMVYASIAIVVALVGYVAVNTVASLTGSDAADSISY